MHPRPTISVVTASFNSARTIRETIESVMRQDVAGVEHIVADGGSTDGTLDILKGYPHLKWLSEKDEGHYDAMNKGIDRSSGELLVMLNADDVFRPAALRAVSEAFQKNPEWDAAFGDVVFVDAAGHKIYQRREAVYDYGVLLYGIDYICHQTMFVRKAAYARLGGYRHKEFPLAADFELKLRLGRSGCKVGHVPELLVNFRYHAGNISSDLKRIRQSNMEAVVIRRAYGNPGGLRGACLQLVFKAKRQAQKLLMRGTIDLVPGNWRLRAYLRERTHRSPETAARKP
jgi:glycosyltransferase involved in cell wall biosynthesis